MSGNLRPSLGAIMLINFIITYVTLDINKTSHIKSEKWYLKKINNVFLIILSNFDIMNISWSAEKRNEMIQSLKDIKVTAVNEVLRK